MFVYLRLRDSKTKFDGNETWWLYRQMNEMTIMFFCTMSFKAKKNREMPMIGPIQHWYTILNGNNWYLFYIDLVRITLFLLYGFFTEPIIAYENHFCQKVFMFV